MTPRGRAVGEGGGPIYTKQNEQLWLGPASETSAHTPKTIQ